MSDKSKNIHKKCRKNSSLLNAHFIEHILLILITKTQHTTKTKALQPEVRVMLISFHS